MAEWLKKTDANNATELEVRGKKIPQVIVQILHNRGYDTPQRIEKFFAPSLEDSYDPYLIPDMEKAVTRLVRARDNKESVLIYGDYDTDGITGAALLNNNLKNLGISTHRFIPQRLIEGYGLSVSGIEYAHQNSCSLLITVDCGITAASEIAEARQKHIDVIVCDHHKPRKDEIPEAACALVNPKLEGSDYPFKDLAGVGVAFKFIQALHKKLHISSDATYEDLDLVALGTVTDIVPLVDENRCFVKHGLKKIKQSQKCGFKALLEDNRLTKDITSYHLGFIIGPRINACGRLRDAREALELFITNDQAYANKIARDLSQDNQKRQEIENIILAEARELIEKHKYGQDRVIVLARENWHQGVIGIVASRISEEYTKPVIMLAIKEDKAKGSGRSVPGFDITDALVNSDKLLIKYGGHKQAAGLEIKTEKIPLFREHVNLYAQHCDENIFKKKHFYDLKLDITDITDDVIFFLKYFEPTGMENPQPLFLAENLEVVGIPRVVGDTTLRFAVRKGTRFFDAIAYGQAENILNIVPGKTRINCLYTVHEDSFTGKKKTVIKIKGMTAIDSIDN